jgi:hypothetical protein
MLLNQINDIFMNECEDSRRFGVGLPSQDPQMTSQDET